MIWQIIIKYTFIFVYSLSNTSTAFFLIPIIFQYIQNANTTITWLHLAIFFCSYETGKLTGNFIWVRLNRLFSTAIILLSSLIPLTILHYSFCFFTSLSYILIHRFLVGLFNSLPLILKKVLSEMSLEKKTLNIYIITSLSSCISVLLPCLNHHVIRSLPSSLSMFNIQLSQFAPATFLLGTINLLAIAFVIIILQMKLLKLKTNNNFIEMNNAEGNDITNEVVKKKTSTSSFVIKKQIEEQQSAERDPIDKNSNRFETIDKQEDKREQTEATKEKGVIKGTAANMSFKGSIVNFNPLNQTTSLLPHKGFKLSLIYLFLQLTDGYYLTMSVITLYINFNGNILLISIGMIGLTSLFALISLPISKSLIKATNDKVIIIKKSKIIMFVGFGIYLLIGALTFGYCVSFISNTTNDNNGISRFIIFFAIMLLILVRNILNSMLIKCYQLYTTIDLQVDEKNRKIVHYYQLHFSTLGKIIAYFISSFTYYFMSYTKEKNFFYFLNSFLYFIILPEGVLLVLFILIKINMIII